MLCIQIIDLLLFLLGVMETDRQTMWKVELV